MACPNGEQDFECWNQLTLRAAAELWTRYSELCPRSDEVGTRTCPDSVLEQHLDRLNTAYFKEAEGALGPINPDGAEGQGGTLKLEVSQ